MRLVISREEHLRRIGHARDQARKRELDALVLFSPAQIFYLTGFAFIATERPIALTITGDTTVLFVPRLEEEHGKDHAAVDQVTVYPEYPTEKHPMARFAEVLAGLKLQGARLGVDGDGYPSVMGYRGPRLSESLPKASVKVVRDLVEEMMMVKSAEEIELIRESARWGNLAHMLLQEYTKPGVIESEVAMRASYDATGAMIRALGPDYRPLSWTSPGARAGYRGQIGKQSAIAHAITTNARIHSGDVLVTGASAAVGGYFSELERTMIVGEPTQEQRRYFGLMLNAQQTAFDAIRPDRPCSDVDRAVRAFFEKHNLMPHWRHHVGHAMGIGIHEAPFFDIGDNTVMRPGMIFTVEPGIYIPDFAGFRHSDTVVVTADGMEMLTYYPRDLERLTIQ